MRERPVILALVAALALVPALASGIEPLALDQSRLKQRLSEVEQRMLEMAALLEPAQPQKAEQLRQAFKLSRDRLIVPRMEEIQSLLDRERYGEAVELQEQVLADLDRLAVSLSSVEWAGELSRLRHALERLEDVASRQAEAARRTEELSRLTAGSAEARLEAAQDQSGIRRDAAGLRADLGAAPGAEHLAGALGFMDEAGRALKDGADADALAAQLEAYGRLQAAQAALRSAIRRLDAQRRAEIRFKVRETLRQMHVEQQAILAETDRIDGLRGDVAAPAEHRPATVPRAELLNIAALAKREQGLLDMVDQAMALVAEDATPLALPRALTAVREDIASCAGLLQAGRTGRFVRGLQEDIIATLADLIEALTSDKARQPLPPDRPPAGEKRERRPTVPVDVVAELKVIRAMQLSVSRQTARLDGLRQEAPGLTDELSGGMRRAADRQGAVKRMVGDLQRALQRSREE